MAFDPEAWEERAAIQQYDGGLSRFRAESESAKAQGMERWEAIANVAGRVVEGVRDQRQALAERAGKDDLPGMQPHPAKEG